jgi:hypothetical protein
MASPDLLHAWRRWIALGVGCYFKSDAWNRFDFFVVVGVTEV